MFQNNNVQCIITYFFYYAISSRIYRYSVDIDLKKTVDEDSIQAAARVDTRKAVKKIFEDRYKNQTNKGDKKAAGVNYFFNKLRF